MHSIETRRSSHDSVRIGPAHLLATLWNCRTLIWSMTKREVQSRHRGSFGGLLWYVIQNLALLAIFAFVFGVIFKARWGGGETAANQSAFAPSLFLGLIIFNVFSEMINRAPTLILSNANYVKKVVFPLDILPIISLGTASFNFLVGVGVLIALATVLGVELSLWSIFLPLVFLPVLLLSLGVSWFLAALGVYVRDAAQVVGILTLALMYFSPIFYSTSALPEPWRSIVLANPLTVPIEQARMIMLFGQEPNFAALGGAILVNLIVAYLGWTWFQLTRKGFADVL